MTPPRFLELARVRLLDNPHMGILEEILHRAAARRGDLPPKAKQIPMPYVTQRRKATKVEGFIYFAAKGSREIKIGYSAHPEERLKEGRVWSPNLRIVAVMPGDKYTEAVVHQRFERDGIQREHFNLSGELGDLIDEIRNKYGLPEGENRLFRDDWRTALDSEPG